LCDVVTFSVLRSKLTVTCTGCEIHSVTVIRITVIIIRNLFSCLVQRADLFQRLFNCSVFFDISNLIICSTKVSGVCCSVWLVWDDSVDIWIDYIVRDASVDIWIDYIVRDASVDIWIDYIVRDDIGCS